MIDRPWMTAVEMQWAVLQKSWDILERTDSPELRWVSTGSVELLPLAAPYAWGAEASAAVLAAAQSVPEASTLRVEDFPSPVSWWWFDAPVPVAMPDSEFLPRIGREIGAIAIGESAIGPDNATRLALIVYRFVRPPDGGPTVLMPTSVYAIPRGRTLATLRDDAMMTDGRTDDDTFRLRRGYEVMRFVVAAAAWMRQRILVTSDGHIERHRRKQLAREFDAPVPSNVKIVELRRLEHEARPHAEGEAVGWSCRWVVNGHWRLQPYRDGVRTIYIHPYVKGPEDKPLRVPTHTAYVVDR